MNYVIVVPDPRQVEINSWGLSDEAEDALFEELEKGLTRTELNYLWQPPAPSPTYVFCFDQTDPLILGLTHTFTFWLVFGSDPNHLYVYQCDYKFKEEWGIDEMG